MEMPASFQITDYLGLVCISDVWIQGTDPTLCIMDYLF